MNGMTLDSERPPEVACQQILLDDASVYSVQWLDLPPRYATQLPASMLLERYLDFVREWTGHLVRPAVTGDGVEFRLLASSVALLSFSTPQLFATEGGEEIRLGICGGVLAQAGECDRGSFSLRRIDGEGAVRVMVQLSDYFPLLLGSRTPSPARRLLYRFTQAYLHKVVTVKYLSRLHRELTGVELRTVVKKVQVREGIET